MEPLRLPGVLRGPCHSPVPPVPLGRLERRGRWQRRDSCVYESAASCTAVEWHLCLLPTQGGHRAPAWAALTAPCSGAPFADAIAGGSLRCDHAPSETAQLPRAVWSRPPGVSPHVPQNASEHLPLLPTAWPARSANVLGVSGKALSLNGMKLTVLEDPQHSGCLPGDAPAGSSGSRSLCLGTAPAAGRACPTCRDDLPPSRDGEPCLVWGRVLRGERGPGGAGAEWQRCVT